MRPSRFAIALGLISSLVFWTSNAQAQESVLDKVKRTGVLKVCNAELLPDDYKDPKTRQWTGPIVDRVNELANWMKVKVEPVEVGWDVAVLSLKQGTCDLWGSILIYNAPRA